jgi:hypothetical protein
MLSVCLWIPLPINFWMPEPIFMKLGIYIVVSELISTAYFINPSHQSVCLYVYPPIVARQRLDKNVTEANNTHATIKELLDASFSVWSESYQRKVGDYFFPEILVYLRENTSSQQVLFREIIAVYTKNRTRHTNHSTGLVLVESCRP